VQLWIEATHALAPDRVAFSQPIRLGNVLSFFTVWSNILLTAPCSHPQS
jgi:acyl-CoA hydrolase